MKEIHQFLEKGGKKSHFLKPISLTAIPLLWSPSLNVCLRAVYALCMWMPGALKALTMNSGAWGFAGFSSKTQAGKRRIPKQPHYVSISAVYYPAKRAWWHTGDRRQPSAASQGILRHSYQNSSKRKHSYSFNLPGWPQSKQNWNSHQAFFHGYLFFVLKNVALFMPSLLK